VGLGHVRLSIIDVEGGLQPMTNEDGSVWIVFNGEIYNFKELHETLVAKGHQFRSRCDTEVIIHLYEEYGVDCLKWLRGMFAFAIWDSRIERLFIARDRVGIKPVYYAQAGGALLFGSELKSILADAAVSRRLSLAAFRRFLAFHYTAGEGTPFAEIQKLAPGHYLVAEEGKVSVQQYWDLAFTRERWGHSFEEAVEELHDLIGRTVSDHMMADVPVGVLLSGGVDSTAVLNFAVQGTEKQVRAFTVGFDDPQVVDERPFARLAAKRFGAEHHELSIGAEDFWKFLPSYVWHMEEPVCEPPAVALYYVSHFARQHVKVLLSGEGGDEAFGGYPNYPHMLGVERLAGRLGPLARPMGALGTWVGRMSGRSGLERYSHALGRPLAEHYWSRTTTPRTPLNRDAARYFEPEFLKSISEDEIPRYMERLLAPVASASRLDQLLYVDTKTWLPDDLLVKADKMTMATSLELRVPLLDHKVLEFAASLPTEYKVRGKETKRVLKAAFSKHIPAEILTRKKAGFPVPYSKWLSGPLFASVRDELLSAQAINRGYFSSKSVTLMLDSFRKRGEFSKEVFCMLVLELWHKRFADR